MARWALRGRRRNTGRGPDTAVTQVRPWGHGAGGAATPCKATLQVLNRPASGGGDKELTYLRGHADREDHRRELERGAWSSEGEVQTHRPKGHPKMRDRGAPCPPPGERRTSRRGERGCSKRTL